MPGFDRSGPRGQGPRTGWGMGYCRPRKDEEQDVRPDAAPVDAPYDVPRGLGRGGMPWGGGRGFGWGGGRGFGGRGRGFGGRGRGFARGPQGWGPNAPMPPYPAEPPAARRGDAPKGADEE